MPKGFSPDFIEVNAYLVIEPVIRRFSWSKGSACSKINEHSFSEIPETEASVN